MSKTAVQKDQLPFQFEGAATSFGGWLGPPKPKPSYVPAFELYVFDNRVRLYVGC